MTDFNGEINNLIKETKSASTETDFGEVLKKIATVLKENFSIEHTITKAFRNISLEPKGVYFPEMYEKIKSQTLLDVKREILGFFDDAKYEFSKQLINKPFEEIIKNEESQFLEFKSTLCWDVKNSKVDKKAMGEIIMKSISAFSNSDGGILLIGVKDDKKILGLSSDYKVFDNGNGNRDDFELHLTTLIINNFSKTFAKENLSIEFPKFRSKDVCLIRIAKGNAPTTVKLSDKSGQLKEKFFIRINNSSRDIENLIELARYIKKRFPEWE